MQQDTIRLSVPAEPAYARAVRMMAANLAVVADMGVDDVEDLRMAAEEGFVYSCATEPSTSDVSFSVGTGSIAMEFSLGDATSDDPTRAYADLLLSAVCDDYEADRDAHVLRWEKESTRELFRRYKLEGDEDAREQLILNHLNLVRFLAAKFKNKGEPLDDLIQVGTVGLIKAIDRFDISRDLEFTTYATPTILGEIKRHFRDKGWSVRVPRRLQELSAKVNKATDELTKDLQRSPSVAEIAEHLDVSVDEVLEAMESSSAYSSVPLEAGSGDDDDAPAVIDRYASEDAGLGTADDRMVIEDTIRDFSPREQDVIRMRFVEGLTQVEIAERLGVSQVQVSRLLRRTLKKIQEKIDPEGLMHS